MLSRLAELLIFGVMPFLVGSFAAVVANPLDKDPVAVVQTENEVTLELRDFAEKSGPQDG